MMNPNCYYGMYYLTDMYHSTIYSNAVVVAKSSFYIYQNEKVLLVGLNDQNKFVKIHDTNPKTFFLKIQSISDTEREKLISYIVKKEYQFVEKYLQSLGVSVYSNNRYEFIDNIEDETDGVENRLSPQIPEHVIELTCINEFSLKQPKISDQEYLSILNQSIFSESYPGLVNILRIYINQDENERIVIYGAGEHTKRVLRLLNKEVINIIGIIDKNAEIEGSYFEGFQVTSPSEIIDLAPTSIYISSYAFELDIYKELIDYEELGIKIIKLYTDHPNYAEDIYKELYLEEHSPRKR